jgi:hypothetical protein
MTVSLDGVLGVTGIVLSMIVGIAAWRYTIPIRHELDELRKSNNQLVLEYWRVLGENTWLRQQLRERGISIPPLPNELRPTMDAAGNISVMISDRGGVQIVGGKLDIAHGDINKTDISGGEVGQAASGRGNDQKQV